MQILKLNGARVHKLNNFNFTFLRIGWLIFLVVAGASFFTACTTPKTTIKKAEDQQPKVQSKDMSRRPTIDYYGLQRKLGLNSAIDKLGYQEKLFSTCDAGHGFEADSRCQLMYFTVIHFQLFCRYSEGTISRPLEKSDMEALSGRPVQWTLANATGQIRLDKKGYGELIGVFSRSPRASRLKLSIGNDNLYTRAGEIKSVITPYTWCAN